ncbi:hypothetical protein FSP39_002744 [Pinctada imbricata]|uniref:DRBM domain-containing protein n=1 Tax=Pinctada imbricata TaxID=66713 RepID=A0AA88Y2D4_PINIB|nr:hypothetical protein FSP39_002744 [Pinctada imbricata]
MAGEQQGMWFDQQQNQGQEMYKQYVQYPTAHMPSQKATTPQDTTTQDQNATQPPQPKLSNKNPVMQLHELRKGLVFDITKNEIEEEVMQVDSQENEEKPKPKKKVNKQLTFTATVTIDGDTFTGTAKSMKLAKQEAAKYLLLKKFNILYVPGYDNLPEDASKVFGTQKRKSTEQQAPGSSKKQKNQAPKNALMALNEHKTGLSYNVTSQTGPVHAPTFVIAVEIDGQTFQGQGTSKKAARTDAAQNACRALNIPFVGGAA